MAGMDVAERRRPQDGRISVMIRKSPLDVRVSTLPTVLGEKVVMRLLDDEALRPSPDQLGIRDQNLRIILDKSILKQFRKLIWIGMTADCKIV